MSNFLAIRYVSFWYIYSCIAYSCVSQTILFIFIVYFYSRNVATHEQQHTYDFIEAQLTTGDNHPVNSEGNTTIANPTYDEAYEILDQINTDDVEMDRNPAYAETTFT